MRRRSENEVSTSTAVAGRSATIAARRLDPVHHRHLEVHQHDVGRRRPAELDRLGAVRGRADQLHVRLRRDHAGRARRAATPWSSASGDADHRDGTSSSTRVPAPSRELIVERAARLPGELLDEREAEVPLREAPRSHLGVEPAAVVRDDEPRACVVDVAPRPGASAASA